MNTLATVHGVTMVPALGSRITSFWFLAQTTSGFISVETLSEVAAADPKERLDVERAQARARMQEMTGRAKDKALSSPDYPDADEHRAQQEAVTRALDPWQDETIWTR